MRLELLSDLHFEFHRDGGRAFVDSLDPTGEGQVSAAGTTPRRSRSVRSATVWRTWWCSPTWRRETLSLRGESL
jgi:hypothetical protein